MLSLNGVIKAGKLHLIMLVFSDEFLILNQIERHQKIYTILTEYLADKLHALSLETYTVDEYKSRYVLVFGCYNSCMILGIS